MAFLAGLLALLAWPFLALWGWIQSVRSTDTSQGDDQAKGEGGESSSQPEEPEGGAGAAEKAPEPSPDEEPKAKEGEGAPEEQPAQGAEEAAGDKQQSSTNRKGTGMSVNPLIEATAELQARLATYAPEDMWQVRQELRQLPQVAEGMALALRTYTQQLVTNYPVNQAVTDQMFEVFQAIANAATPAAEVAPIFENVHSAEIARADTPRPNEATWNV